MHYKQDIIKVKKNDLQRVSNTIVNDDRFYWLLQRDWFKMTASIDSNNNSYYTIVLVSTLTDDNS